MVTPTTFFSYRQWHSHHSQLFAKAKTNNKKKGSTTASGGIKGFGGMTTTTTTSPSSSSASSAASSVSLDRSAPARRFFEALEQASYKLPSSASASGAAASSSLSKMLKKTALAYFYNNTLRGVVALRDIDKGEDILSIPYELAINLGCQQEEVGGQEPNGDPTIPAVELLRDYCQTMMMTTTTTSRSARKSSTTSATATTTTTAAQRLRRAYYEMLPPFGGRDCRTSTDFFSDQALEALQSPWIVQETLQRRERVRQRFQQDIAAVSAAATTATNDGVDDDSTDKSFPTWIDGTPVTPEHLQWAVWLVTSRVLTVQGKRNNDIISSYRLLIPYLDMCNHDRSSPHILTGRADPGAMLKVIAGRPVQAGEQINICYGGAERTGNDHFIQDYGFLDMSSSTSSSSSSSSSLTGFRLVAQQLLGDNARRPQQQQQRFASQRKTLSQEDRERALEALRATTITEDEEELRKLLQQRASDDDIRIAIEFRIGVKKALAELIGCDGDTNSV